MKMFRLNNSNICTPYIFLTCIQHLILSIFLFLLHHQSITFFGFGAGVKSTHSHADLLDRNWTIKILLCVFVFL